MYYFFIFILCIHPPGNLAKSQRIKNKGRYRVPGFRPRTTDNSRETSQQSQSRDSTLRGNNNNTNQGNSRRVIIGAENMSGSTTTAHPHNNSFRANGRAPIHPTKSSDDSFRTAPLHGTGGVSVKQDRINYPIGENEPQNQILHNEDFGTRDDGDIQFTMLPSTREMPPHLETEHPENNNVVGNNTATGTPEAS